MRQIVIASGGYLESVVDIFFSFFCSSEGLAERLFNSYGLFVECKNL